MVGSIAFSFFCYSARSDSVNTSDHIDVVAPQSVQPNQLHILHQINAIRSKHDFLR